MVFKNLSNTKIETFKNFNEEEAKKQYYLGGSLHIENLFYSPSKKLIVFKATYNCGKLCGQSYICILKQKLNVWYLDKVKVVAIS
ncbi:hypothetical protein SAMN06265376_10418 [Dokdonia pacifica]|uniref:Uncharacterized protein n=2 Tax=Dokdonia pacifica TaxID=1627892 RepID=A0A238ZXU9_9FLAO|nr:hypothetical protein SAMN06265376_10418 [Dokdonia pacifica]